jgi:hypothetical protein
LISDLLSFFDIKLFVFQLVFKILDFPLTLIAILLLVCQLAPPLLANYLLTASSTCRVRHRKYLLPNGSFYRRLEARNIQAWLVIKIHFDIYLRRCFGLGHLLSGSLLGLGSFDLGAATLAFLLPQVQLAL